MPATLNRGDAVNLARNALADDDEYRYLGVKSLHTLAQAVIAMDEYIKAHKSDAEPIAWLIELTVSGQPHRVACLHNAIADYREIDPNAKVTPLCAIRDNTDHPTKEK